MSGWGRKRAAGNAIMQQQGQVRQGSSFWTCPGCNTAVHTALMAFHISSCPVVAADEVAAPMKKTAKPLLPDRRQRIDEEKQREEQEIGQSTPLGSPEFTTARKRNVSVREEDDEDEFSIMPRGSPRPRNRCVCEDDWDEKERDVLQEEQPLTARAPSSSSHLSVDVGGKGDKLLSCPHPETPIQEGRDRIGVDLQRTVLPTSPPAEVRKRLFEDWGDQLSPEPPEFVVQNSPSPNEAAAAAAGSPSLVNPQAKRPRVVEFDRDECWMVVDLGLMDSGGTGGDLAEGEISPYLGSVLDSQQERHEEAVSPDRTETSPQEHEKTLEADQKLQASNFSSLETAAEIQDGNRIGDGLSRRELQLENVIGELKQKCAGALLKETTLQKTLDLKNEECERLRRREQELQSELLSVRGQLENTLQELRDIVDRGEQQSANEIHRPDHSATQVYKGDESIATQLLSQTSNTASRSNSPTATKDGFVITRVSSVSSQNLMKAHNLVDIANEEQATQLVSDGLDSPDTDEGGQNSQASAEFRRVSGSRTGPSDVEPGEPFLSLEAAMGKGDEFLAQRLFEGGTSTHKRILNDEVSSAVLAPHTPGKALLKPGGEHEERAAFGGHDSYNLHTMGNQRTEVTPGGGPKTPENFAVMLGGQEKGLISEMLDSFPPAQGIESHGGIDPFDDHFREAVNEITSKVPNASIPMQEESQKFISDGVDDKIRLHHERLDACQPPASPQASENSQQETTGEIASKKKRRRPAFVIDSDSDEDVRDCPDPMVEIPRTDRQLGECPSVNVTLPSDEEEDICGGSGGSGKKEKRRRLIKVQESPDRTKTLKPDPDSEGTKETSADELRRRSERLRNAGRRESLGTSGQGSRANPHVLDDDDEVVDLDSDLSDGGLTGSLHKPRKDIANQKHTYSGARRALFFSKQDVEDEEVDDIESDDSGFINDDQESDADGVDEISDIGDESENDGSSRSTSSSDGREKYNWDLEGDMLAALGKDTELCLRGLCAIYRRQEEDEKYWASSKYRNKRGFSTFHSARASMIASFLMGDTNIGPVVKTVKELMERFDEAAVTYCSDMCNHYSKQLFEIYLNNEDPYFPEPYTDPVM